MRLADKLGISSPETRRRNLFARFGILENPFPPAGQTMGHQHKETSADDEIVRRLTTFLNDKTTQVLVVEGTQGIGKTNLLEYYTRELAETFPEDTNYYIIRYYPDPEPDFGKVVQRIVQAFGIDHIQKIGMVFATKLSKPLEQEEILSVVRGYDTRQAFLSLARAARDPQRLAEVSSLVFDFLLGMRVLTRHSKELGVQFRLDTTESKTQALHDLVFFSQKLGCLEGIFLFLDELEKVGGMTVQQVTRYLSSVRALIDALPKFLFMILAMVPIARVRYSQMLPALAGRLEAPIPLSPLNNASEAVELYRFYLQVKRQEAKDSPETMDWDGSDEALPLSEQMVREAFTTLVKEGERRGVPQVTQRAFLDRLHTLTEQGFANLR